MNADTNAPSDKELSCISTCPSRVGGYTIALTISGTASENERQLDTVNLVASVKE